MDRLLRTLFDGIGIWVVFSIVYSVAKVMVLANNYWREDLIERWKGYSVGILWALLFGSLGLIAVWDLNHVKGELVYVQAFIVAILGIYAGQDRGRRQDNERRIEKQKLEDAIYQRKIENAANQALLELQLDFSAGASVFGNEGSVRISCPNRGGITIPVEGFRHLSEFEIRDQIKTSLLAERETA